MANNSEKLREAQRICEEFCKSQGKKLKDLDPQARAILITSAVARAEVETAQRRVGSNRFGGPAPRGTGK